MMTPTIYGMGVALSMLLLLLMVAWQTRKQHLPANALPVFAIASLVASFLFSRLLFVLSNIPYYFVTLDNPALMLHFWDGGASMLGAIVGVLLSTLLVEKAFHLSSGLLMDAVALGAPLAICLERLIEGFFGDGMGVGKTIVTPFLMPLGQWLDGCHPVFLYEAVAMLLIAVALHISRKKARPQGDTMLLFLLLYGTVQVVLESLRNDSHMIVIHFVRISQIGAIVLTVLAMGIFTARAVRQHRAGKKQLLPLWLVTAVCIGLGIALEFAVDRLGEPLLAYSLMALVLAVIAACGLRMRVFANGITQKGSN